MLHKLVLLGAIPFVSASVWPREKASSYAGSTATFQFPPANVTATVPDPHYPDASQVGFAGPTPSTCTPSRTRPDARTDPLLHRAAGDEAAAVATAPSLAKIDDAYPLVRPDTSDHKGSTFNVLKYWGNLSPMYSVDSAEFGLPGTSELVPEGCGLTQVHLLHRHGARYPTSGSSPANFAAKLHNASAGAGFDATGSLEFLATWKFKLGAEILTPFGREQL